MTVPGIGRTETEGRLLGRVVSRERVGPFVLLELDVPGWRPARPGQFAMLQAEDSRRFLPRALSVHDQRGEQASFLVSPVGPGTDELVHAQVDHALWVLGPLGRGFDLGAMSAAAREAASDSGPPSPTAPPAVPAGSAGGAGPPGPNVPRLVVVAGGVGIAPFGLLLRALVFADPETDETEDAGLGFGEVLVLLGFRDQAQAEAAGLFEGPVQALRDAGLPARLEVISEDGSLGRCGLVTALLGEEVRPGDAVASCGAHGMCVAAWQVAQVLPGIRTWFSLEAPMACGVGSCQGCVVEAADGALVKVCRRGPVFAGEEVFRSGEDASCGLEERTS